MRPQQPRFARHASGMVAHVAYLQLAGALDRIVCLMVTPFRTMPHRTTTNLLTPILILAAAAAAARAIAVAPGALAPAAPVLGPAVVRLPELLALAVGESSVILLHPPLPLLGFSTGVQSGCHQNGSLADG